MGVGVTGVGVPVAVKGGRVNARVGMVSRSNAAAMICCRNTNRTAAPRTRTTAPIPAAISHGRAESGNIDMQTGHSAKVVLSYPEK
jgi:hypothetical protein